MGKYAKHNNYSRHIIAEEFQNFKAGKYPRKRDMYDAAAERLGIRWKQAQGQARPIINDDLKPEDFPYTEEDIQEFYGGEEEISRAYHNKNQPPRKREPMPTLERESLLTFEEEEPLVKLKPGALERREQELGRSLRPEEKELPTQEEIDQALEEKDIFEQGYNAGHNDGYEEGTRHGQSDILKSIVKVLNEKQKVKLIQMLANSINS